MRLTMLHAVQILIKQITLANILLLQFYQSWPSLFRICRIFKVLFEFLGMQPRFNLF